MPRQTLIADGLWYCLCPSFSLNTFKRPGIPLIKGKRAPKPGQYTAFLAGPVSTSRKCLSSASIRKVGGIDPPKEDGSLGDGYSEPTNQHTAPNQLDVNHKQLGQDAGTSLKEEISGTEYTHKRPPGVPKTLEHKPTSFLEQKLQELTTSAPRVLSTSQILRILIRDRHVRPEVRHYRALLRANSDAERGSPEVVRKLLAEMEANGFTLDSGTLHTALQAIAVHPDYILRQEIVRTLRDRWLPLSPDGWHYVVAGLVREHQFELALDHIAHMERKDMPVESWLHSMLIYHLCEFEEFDEVVRLMRSRVDQGYDMTTDLWLYVLDVASAAVHHETTRFVWDQMVELRYLYPSYGVCSNVLTVASRTGDTELAGSVARFLTEADVPLSVEDYEKITEAHVISGNLYAGFEVLCEMHKANIALESSSTAAILTYMIQSRTNPREAWSMLKQLKALKYEIPLRCALVVLEMCEHEAINDPFVVDDGLALYKQLYALCSEKADVSVYNSLIGMCRRAKNTDAGMFVVKEMATLGVVPNATTFEHLIIMCLDAGNFESAYMYFQDLLARDASPSEDARAEIRDLCTGSSDQYAVQLRYHPQIRDALVRRQADGFDPTQVRAGLIKKVPSDSPPEYANRFRQGPRRTISKEERRAESKEKRKQKRRRLAIARAREEEGWEDYEPGGLIPEDQVKADVNSPSS
ncbi:pentatricopeptide repeat protein [Aspergillus bombycis]|uniref:Pentatricopeptide repeat protein n=1 Tax=Aspergillus bombycis TaxID=109264 RepID=A0A1F8A199_9EURO|nr:pentatricopeptide repeat protein [Aspergillus bombycis]OGM45484.1 pentatricopeptide repeat protein [Aspergillus bombycis]